MILESLFGLSLVLNVSLDSTMPMPPGPNPLQLAVPQKDAALLPLVARATDCIVGKVLADPHYRSDLRRDEVNHLIAASLGACTEAIDALVETHDRLYGDGSGEAFLFGPYFDRLSSTVSRQARSRAGADSR